MFFTSWEGKLVLTKSLRTGQASLGDERKEGPDTQILSVPISSNLAVSLVSMSEALFSELTQWISSILQNFETFSILSIISHFLLLKKGFNLLELTSRDEIVHSLSNMMMQE